MKKKKYEGFHFFKHYAKCKGKHLKGKNAEREGFQSLI